MCISIHILQTAVGGVSITSPSRLKASWCSSLLGELFWGRITHNLTFRNDFFSLIQLARSYWGLDKAEPVCWVERGSGTRDASHFPTRPSAEVFEDLWFGCFGCFAVCFVALFEFFLGRWGAYA